MTAGPPEQQRGDDVGPRVLTPARTEGASNGMNGSEHYRGRTALLEVGADPTYRPSTTLNRAAGDGGLRLTWESLAYLLLIVAAALTRFWDLGSRALHHDESLHAYYSWLFATGEGYQHNPLMHGPFLFHANALVYILFGDSDATSRWMPALFGTILVGLALVVAGAALSGSVRRADGQRALPDLARFPLLQSLHPPRHVHRRRGADPLYLPGPLSGPTATALAGRRGGQPDAFSSVFLNVCASSKRLWATVRSCDGRRRCF